MQTVDYVSYRLQVVGPGRNSTSVNLLLSCWARSIGDTFSSLTEALTAMVTDKDGGSPPSTNTTCRLLISID